MVDEIEIMFTDITINDAKCSRSIVEKLMTNGSGVKEWMLESNVGLAKGHVESLGVIQFWNNGEAILTQFQSGFHDEMIPVDVIFLNEYLSEYGWEFVINEDVVMNDMEYWERYFSIISENEVSEEKIEEKDGEDDENNDLDFVEYSKKLEEYKRPKANKYNMLSIDEFKDHDYDLKKRNKIEEENKF